MAAGQRLRALVLAAGRGERLRPLTLEIPKPLLPVAGRPLAAWTLDRLARIGCGAAALNLHHLGDPIRAGFGERFGAMPLVYSAEPELLGTGGALPPLADFFAAGERLLLVNGDSLCRWPLAELLARHRARGASATLLVHARVDPRAFGGGVAVEDGRIVAFRPSSLAWQAARRRRVFAGAAVLEPELVARLPEGPSDIVSALYEPLLVAGERISALATSRAWFDLGTPERYLEGALAWALIGRPEGAAWSAADAEIAASARLRRVAVETGATIGPRARLRETLVLPGARIGAGAQLERCIVGPGVEIADGTVHRRTLLTRDPERPERLVETPLVRPTTQSENSPTRPE